MNNSKKIIIIIFILTTIITASCYYLLRTNQKIIPGYVSTNIRYISSEESGRLIRLNVKEGQLVKKGDLLYSLDSIKMTHDTKGQLDNTKVSANIISANADLKYAKAEYLRQKKLLSYDSTSEKSYQSAYANYIKAKAKVDSANVKSIEKAYVYQIFYQPGEEISAYNPVVSLINPDDVYIVFYVSKEDLDKVHLGKQITLKTDTGSQSTATVNYISKDAEYTPPLLYGINADSEISFEVKAKIEYSANSSDIHIGEPVRVSL
ncbi:hypothetical protein LO80_05025 [Candidatus Francisella endociliophora]|uniref:Multidrug resistance protein MdtA-like barrel-sandwich hybrid domain-containing protein n=1 Tax=Candidatus Francisella endociliophora TaxID=653937 RepID=A0A097EPA2_9GAMM|nr:HlyD family efflux transporter periplasmic adaptor subunit [Francisella sp. FSC1006]AIT09390.1 hypothetical protein LO80_05025 [Francisella sp. FSC1006]